MHELSIASQIWKSVARAAAEHRASRVQAVTLEVGVLNLLEEEQLTFWIKMLAEREGSPGLEVKVRLLPGRVRCLDCGRESEASPAAGEVDHFLPLDLRCATCRSANVRPEGGYEIRVVSAEIEPGGQHE